MSVLAIIISLLLLMYLAYKGWSVIVLAPLLALLAVIMTDSEPILATYTQIFMKALGGFIMNFFPIFLLGSIFGMLMDKSGYAACIAKNVLKFFNGKFIISAVVISCAVLTYGGVSLFVVAFSVYPIANNLFYNSNIPKKFIPACIALGSFTFTMVAMPGTPSIQNAIPMPYFGTNIYAAPILGIITSIAMLSFGILWLNIRVSKSFKNGEGYGNHSFKRVVDDENEEKNNFFISISPIILMMISNYMINKYISTMDTSYLSEAKFGTTKIDSVRGMWSIISAMFITCVYTLILSRKKIISIVQEITNAVSNSFLPIFNTASEVGYGAVIASLAGFVVIKQFIGTISNTPVIDIMLSVNILAGITGSSSGGLSIALQALGENFAALGKLYNISPEILHRVSVIASSGLDTLPHCGAVITLLNVCNLKHKDSYFDIYMVSSAGTSLCCIFIMLYAFFIGF